VAASLLGTHIGGSAKDGAGLRLAEIGR
jgi:hypothetical protein